MSGLKEFGVIAKGLARNPLGIIALFIVLVYGIAAMLLGLSGSGLSVEERVPLVWFLVLFPVLVPVVFAWLVARHHRKLYSPRDYRDEKNFLGSMRPELKELPRAVPHPVPGDNSSDIAGDNQLDLATPQGRSHHRNSIYRENRGVFLAHILAPSGKDGQDFDIFVYLIRHKGNDLSDVAEAEFFLGNYWGNEIFPGAQSGNAIGIRISAYGPFLCTCVVTFKDGESCVLERYIDFEMGRFL